MSLLLSPAPRLDGSPSPFLAHFDARDPLDELGRIRLRTGQLGTFDRTSPVWLPDRNGVLTKHGRSAPGFGWIGGRRGLWMQGNRQNTLTWSNDLTNAAWSASNATPTLAAMGPDGIINSASVLIENGVNAGHFTQRSGPTITAGASQAFAVFVRARGRTRGRVLFTNNAGTNGFGATFNLLTMTATAATSGAGTSSLCRIEPWWNGWFRILTAGVVDGVSTTTRVYLELADASGNLSYLGDSTSGLEFFCVQHEAGVAFPSSPTPTTSTAVTRQPDALSLSFLAPPQAGTLYLDCTTVGLEATAGNPGMVNIGISGDPRLGLIGTGSAGGIATEQFSDGGAVNSVVFPPSGYVFGARAEARGVFNPDGSTLVGAAINGGTESLGSVSAARAYKAAFANLTLTVYASFFVVHRLIYAPGVWTLAQLRAAAA